MTLTSISFFAFLAIMLVAYYICKPAQKYILLAGSIYFYFAISSTNYLKILGIILYIFLITYLSALFISKTAGKSKKSIYVISIILIVSALVALKYATNMVNEFISIFKINTEFSFWEFGSVIGLSYYSLSAMGYITDVYWDNYKAEKNPVDVALFIFYFPQIISGPITRFGEMNKQFNSKIRLDSNNIYNGLQRMIWGYFKKLVISDRVGVIVSEVYGNYESYHGVFLFFATICYALQLYTDFSGCMDIVLGASKMFGIDLPENFKAPFFSETIQEFWQKWHITLGVWFKEYVMYPLQKSVPIQKLTKKTKKVFGKKFGKKIPFYISMLVLWVLIGMWHGGTLYYFVASGAIPFLLLLCSDICAPIFVKLTKLLKINTECGSYKWFRRVRTILLVCVGWLFICAGDCGNAIDIVGRMFTLSLPHVNVSEILTNFGVKSIIMFFVGGYIVYIEHVYENNGDKMYQILEKQNFLFQIMVIYIEVIAIYFIGMVGKSSFIYFQF